MQREHYQREHYNRLLASLIILGMIAAPALGFSVSYTSGDGSGAVSSSSSYNLDDSSSLQQHAILAGSGISQISQASGTGNNSMENTVGGSGYSLSNEVTSSGSMGVSTSAVATGSGAGISQNAALSGKSGGVSLSASSQNNQMAVSGGFSGDGDMFADLSAVAADRAAMSGSASIVGVPVLSDDNLQQIASGDIGMSVDGLYTQASGELGKFGLSSVNVEAASASGTPAYLTGASGGSSNSYRLAGWRWNSISSTNKINLIAKTTNPAITTAVYNAAKTWNAATNKKPFGTVSSSTSVNTDTHDGKNVVAFKHLSEAPTALAYSRTWYNYNKVGGYYSAVESDLSLNTRYGWSTTLADNSPYRGGSIDVQTVVLHELGHTIGLGDLYNLPRTDPRRSDYSQVMNAYNDVQRTLGNGDRTGAPGHCTAKPGPFSFIRILSNAIHSALAFSGLRLMRKR